MRNTFAGLMSGDFLLRAEDVFGEQASTDELTPETEAQKFANSRKGYEFNTDDGRRWRVINEWAEHHKRLVGPVNPGDVAGRSLHDSTAYYAQIDAAGSVVIHNVSKQGRGPMRPVGKLVARIRAKIKS